MQSFDAKKMTNSLPKIVLIYDSAIDDRFKRKILNFIELQNLTCTKIYLVIQKFPEANNYFKSYQYLKLWDAYAIYHQVYHHINIQ